MFIYNLKKLCGLDIESDGVKKNHISFLDAPSIENSHSHLFESRDNSRGQICQYIDTDIRPEFCFVEMVSLTCFNHIYIINCKHFIIPQFGQENKREMLEVSYPQ